MSALDQINQYISAQDPTKREEMQALHHMMLSASPDCKLWFLDGRNDNGKIVSNPNIGYGSIAKIYANGKAKEFYKIGLSANASGISVYFMGVMDKKYLSDTYGDRLGKADITGYCVRFRKIGDINVDVLGEMVADHMDMESARGA